MQNHDQEHFRERLQKERQDIEQTLRERGHKIEGQDDWQGVSTDVITDTADVNEVADQIEELANNVAIVEELEKRLHAITAALAKIENGTYGICDVCGERIPQERLEANPAAATCTAHA